MGRVFVVGEARLAPQSDMMGNAPAVFDASSIPAQNAQVRAGREWAEVGLERQKG